MTPPLPQATLERHLEQFDLSTVQVGLFFMVNYIRNSSFFGYQLLLQLFGAAYALLNPFWGWMADRLNPKVVIMVGASLLATGFLLVGPAPFLPLAPTSGLTALALIIAGTGLGAQVSLN